MIWSLREVGLVRSACVCMDYKQADNYCCSTLRSSPLAHYPGSFTGYHSRHCLTQSLINTDNLDLSYSLALFIYLFFYPNYTPKSLFISDTVHLIAKQLRRIEKKYVDQICLDEIIRKRMRLLT